MSNEPLRVSNNNDMHQNFTVEGPGLQVLEKYINRFYKSPNTHTHTHVRVVRIYNSRFKCTMVK